MPPREFLNALLDAGQYLIALEFLAGALFMRESIWWGALCLQHASGERLEPAEKAAAIAAVRFVLHPMPQNCAAARMPAQAAGPTTIAGALALAASQSCTNTSPSSAGQLTPAKAIANAVKLASVKANPAKLSDTRRLYVELGIGVAEGRFVIPEISSRRACEKWDWELQEEKA